jgi:hypothetical protein
MFSFPVTVPVRKNESIFPVIVSVNCDDVLVVNPLLDKQPPFGVESASSDMIPLTEILFQDGRKLPVLERPEIIHDYLDAYLALEEFYTDSKFVCEEEVVEYVDDLGDNVIPLFGTRKPCDTSEGSTPDLPGL